MDDDALFQQFLLRDAKFNGQFVTGVITTGIYCLPSCPARRPKRENVRFFRTPAAAIETGLRACLRCRPDHFYGGAEWHETLFEQTAGRVRANPAAFAGIPSLARAAGLSRTALNDLFRDHAHESPAAFLRRTRVEHVCQSLQQGVKPADAGTAAGFASSSSFHQQFVARTGLTPGAYAGLGDSTAPFTLRLPKPFRIATVLDFYGRDAENVSESVSATGLRKCFLAGDHAVLAEIQFQGDRAVCVTDAGFAGHAAVTRMLGFESDAAGFERRYQDDDLLGPVIARQHGLHVPLTPGTWEALAWAIIGQQISVGFAVTLRRELIKAAGALHSSGLRAHPSAAAVAALSVDTLRRLKFSTSKAEYLIGAARAVAAGELALDTLRQMSALRAARLLGGVLGVGPWTVQYALLRGIGFADGIPAGDAGLAQGLLRITGTRPNEAGIRAALAKYAPCRSLATYHLWASLKALKGDLHEA